MNDLQSVFQYSYANKDPLIPATFTNVQTPLDHPQGMYPPGLEIGKTTAGVVQSSSFRRRDGLGYVRNGTSDLNIATALGKRGIQPKDPRPLFMEKTKDVPSPEDTILTPTFTMDEARSKREQNLVAYHNELKRARAFLTEAAAGVNPEENLRLANNIREDAQRQLFLSDPNLAKAVARGLQNTTGIDTPGEIEGLFDRIANLVARNLPSETSTLSSVWNDMQRSFNIAETKEDEFFARRRGETTAELSSLREEMSDKVASIVQGIEEFEEKAAETPPRRKPTKKLTKDLERRAAQLENQLAEARELSDRSDISLGTSTLDKLDQIMEVVSERASSGQPSYWFTKQTEQQSYKTPVTESSDMLEFKEKGSSQFMAPPRSQREKKK